MAGEEGLIVFLRSRFDAKGVKEAEVKLRKIKRTIKRLNADLNKEQPDPFMFLGRSQESLRAIKELSKGVEQSSDVFRRAAQGAARLNDEVAFESFVKGKKNFDALGKSVESLITDEDKLKLALDRQIVGEEKLQAGILRTVAALERKAKALRMAAAQAAAQGTPEAAEESQALLRQAEAATRLAQNTEKLTDAQFRAAGGAKKFNQNMNDVMRTEKKADVITRVLTSKFNQFGFALFVTTSTLRMITQGMKGLFDAMAEGAGAIDRFEAFTAILSGEGINTQKLRKNLKDASQGVVEMDTAFKKAIQLMKAGLPEIAEKSDAFLKVAVNSAKLSGELEKADEIYSTLINGIIRGEPRLIDNAEILIKVGQATDAYAQSLGLANAEELTAKQRSLAIADAVEEAAVRINAQAEEIDSLGIKFAKLSTDLKDSTKFLKEFSAELTVENLTAAGQLFEILAIAIAGGNAETAKLVENFQSLAGVTGTYLASFASGLEVVRSLIDSTLGKSIQAATDNFIDLAVATNSLMAAFQAKDIEAANQAITQLATDLTENLILASGHTETFGEAIEKAFENGQAAYDKWAERFGLYTPRMDEASETTERFGFSLDNLRENLLGVGGALTQVFSKLDIVGRGLSELERQEKLVDSQEEFRDSIVEIQRDLAENIGQINENLSDRLTSLAENHATRMTRISEDLNDRISDINEDLSDKLADISEDIAGTREKRQRKHNKKLEDIEEDHQKRIRAIMERFELSRMNALIDRDARALFEAQQRRDSDLRNAQETSQEKRESEIEDFQETLNELRQMEEQRRQDAIKAAERRRQDARKQAERQRKDALKNLERQQKDAEKAAEKRRQSAMKRFAQQQRDAVLSFNKQMDDLRNWHRDRLLEQQKAELEQRNSQLQDLLEKEGMTTEFITKQQQLWLDYQEFLNSVRLSPESSPIPGTPGDGQLPPPGGTLPPPIDDSGLDNIAPGAPCNYRAGRGVTGPDGLVYMCVNGSWSLVSDIFPGGGGNRTGNLGGGFGAGRAIGGGIMGGVQPIGATNGGRMPVTINVNGDQLLEEIFKNISYDAFIEIIGES